MNTVKNGKGSDSRITNISAWRENFDEIDWGHTTEAPLNTCSNCRHVFADRCKCGKIQYGLTANEMNGFSPTPGAQPEYAVPPIHPMSKSTGDALEFMQKTMNEEMRKTGIPKQFLENETPCSKPKE
jgi:hypothetical protein